MPYLIGMMAYGIPMLIICSAANVILYFKKSKKKRILDRMRLPPGQVHQAAESQGSS